MSIDVNRPDQVRPGGLGTPPGRHLVGLDIDGTTVLHDGTLRETVREAVAAAVDAGHDIVMATGRSLLGARPVIDALGLSTGYAVCSNGAVTIELHPRHPGGARIARCRQFDPAPVIARIRGTWPEAALAVERVGVGFDVSHPFPEGELDGRIRVVSWDELTAHLTTRITACDGSYDLDAFAATVDRLGLRGVHYAVGYTPWLDITPEGVCKASALEVVRARLGIPRERTVVVGDQRNDLEMLAWAACGVAMGNAPADVAAAADLRTADVGDDGLVDVLAALPPA